MMPKILTINNDFTDVTFWWDNLIYKIFLVAICFYDFLDTGNIIMCFFACSFIL